MRATQFFLNTLKEAPADAEVISHQLMMRAGMIKRLAGGIYTYMPVGLRSIRKVENIVREEMNRAGALELLMPAVQPAELWQESGRWENRFFHAALTANLPGFLFYGVMCTICCSRGPVFVLNF